MENNVEEIPWHEFVMTPETPEEKERFEALLAAHRADGEDYPAAAFSNYV